MTKNFLSNLIVWEDRLEDIHIEIGNNHKGAIMLTQPNPKLKITGSKIENKLVIYNKI